MNHFLKICLFATILMVAACATPPEELGERTHRAITNTHVTELTDWSTDGGKGQEARSSECAASEGSYRSTRQGCGARVTGDSLILNNQHLPPGSHNRGIPSHLINSLGFGSNYPGGVRDPRFNSHLYGRNDWYVGAKAGFGGQVQMRPYRN